jgi:hypothetical protein
MKRWSRRYLQRAFKGGRVVVGDQPIFFDAYCRYADANRDELPLYLCVAMGRWRGCWVAELLSC